MSDIPADLHYSSDHLWVRVDADAGLVRAGRGLPETPVLDVKITGDDTTLYAATFGRSVWSIPIG